LALGRRRSARGEAATARAVHVSDEHLWFQSGFRENPIKTQLSAITESSLRKSCYPRLGSTSRRSLGTGTSYW
jgi:hypothetical protein